MSRKNFLFEKIFLFLFFSSCQAVNKVFTLGLGFAYELFKEQKVFFFLSIYNIVKISEPARKNFRNKKIFSDFFLLSLKTW